MSGIRLQPYREGDRSEYLALYILSALGLVTQVPRQEDIGFDFVCSIANQETGKLSFNFSYLVTVKSLGDPNVSFFPAKTWDGKVPVHVDWIFSQDSPLYLALVDQEESRLFLYSFTPIYYSLYTIGKNLGALTLVPRTKPRKELKFDAIKLIRKLREFPSKGQYKMDLGEPMVVIRLEDIKTKKNVAAFKSIMREDIKKQRAALRFLQMGVPYFEPRLYKTNLGSDGVRYFFLGGLEKEGKRLGTILTESVPILCALALHYKKHGPIELTEAICKVLRLSYDEIPDKLKESLEDYL